MHWTSFFRFWAYNVDFQPPSINDEAWYWFARVISPVGTILERVQNKALGIYWNPNIDKVVFSIIPDACRTAYQKNFA